MIGTILGILAAIIAVLVALFKKKKPKPPVTNPPKPLPNGVHLTLISLTTQAIPTDITAYLEAQQAQIDLDFSPAWGGSAVIDQSPGGWPVYLLDTSDVQNALGYHDVDRSGIPYAKVFLQTAKSVGVAWQSVASHEVLEVLGDSNANTTDLGADGCQWVQEVGDPVEDKSYTRLGVTLSDFVTPNWFTIGGSGPFDFLRVLTAPFTVTPGGYAIEVCNGQTVTVGGNAEKSIDKLATVKRGYKR